MLTSTSTLTYVSALLGAGAYDPDAQPADARAQADPRAIAEIHGARVEIYCGHNDQAVLLIRAARDHLLAMAGAAPTQALALTELDRASWLTRHDQYEEAELALDAALSYIGSSSITRTAASQAAAAPQGQHHGTA